MTNVVKFLSTRSFFQLGAELKREKYSPRNDRNTNQQLWIAFFITFVFFIWAVYALIKYQPVLPAWVIVLGILLLFAPAGPLLTLILVYYCVGTLGNGDKSDEKNEDNKQEDESQGVAEKPPPVETPTLGAAKLTAKKRNLFKRPRHHRCLAHHSPFKH